MNPIKKKINDIVEEYKEVFSEEYDKFCRGMSVKQDLQENEHASMKGDGFIEQYAREVPTTLSEMFNDMLTQEEMAFYNSKEGAIWFGQTFKEFTPAKNL